MTSELQQAESASGLAPLFRTCDQRLSALLSNASFPVTSSGRAALLAWLQRRVLRICEIAAGGAPDADPGFAQLLLSCPAVPPLLERVAGDWLAAASELLERLGRDGPRLAEGLFAGAPLAALDGLRADLGDVHAGGRSVLGLQFDSGQRLLYKPKDLRVVACFRRLTSWLGERGLALDLWGPALVLGRHHAWEAYVEPAPCLTVESVARFYRRMGMMLRLTQLLEARDLWLDNVIAAGEYPVFIDLETLLQPRWRSAGAGSPAHRAALQLWRESVVPLGILSMPVPIAPGVPSEDVGAVAAPRSFRLPYRRPGGQSSDPDFGFRSWTHDAHAPRLDGQPQPAGEHVGDILAGYRSMQDCLAANRRQLLQPASPLLEFAGCQVRVVLRDTWAYQRILEASFRPDLLTDAYTRSAALAAADWGMGARDAPPLQPAFEHERLAIQRTDIPYFACGCDGTDLLSASGAMVCPAVFEATAYTRAWSRVEQVDAHPLERHESMIVSTLAAAERRDPDRRPRLVTSDGHIDWISEASRVGDRILAAAVEAGHQRAWIGLAHDPTQDFTRLAVLGPDLLSGTAGIAVAFSDLFVATGEKRFRDAALAILSPLVRPDTLTGEPPGLRGVAGYLYTLCRCERTLGLPLGRLEMLTAVSARAETDPTPWDLVSGVVGLGLGLLAAGGDAESAAKLARVAAERAARDVAADDYPPKARVRAALPGGPAALRLLQHRLALRGVGPSVPQAAAGEGKQVGDLLVEMSVSDPDSNGSSVEQSRQLLGERQGRLLDRGALAIEAARATGDGWFSHQAEALAAELVASQRQGGKWLPDSAAADEHELSLVWGLPAVIELFLQVGAQGQSIPQARLMDMTEKFLT